jgi:hypothetical protein
VALHERQNQKLNKVLVGVLRECETQEQVENTFNRFGMTDVGDKTEHLTLCMGNPLAFFAGEEPDAATKYATVLSMFLTGEWMLNEVYEKNRLAHGWLLNGRGLNG